ncbi:MAG: L,D-transpeptidase family protein [Bacteroidetes bacterium]|nr:L,D-transpeptidase family protein [Bacteroidota bacterium]
MPFHRRLIYYFLAVPFLLLSGCSWLPDYSDSVEAAPQPVVRSIDTDAIAQQVHKLFAVPSFRETLVHDDTLLQQYRQREYVPLWVNEDSFPSRVIVLLRFLMHSDEHGLDPEWYHVATLQALLDAILTDGRSDSDHNESLARIELLLSDGLLRYASHLRYGVVDPRSIDDAYHLPVARPGLHEFLQPLQTPDIIAFLRNIQPDAARYRKLQRAYAGFRDIKRLYRWPRIPDLTVSKVLVGDTSSAVPALTQRLMLTGELFTSYQAPLRGTVQLVDLALQAFELDSLRLQTLGPYTYDSSLAKAVMRYQERHGLLVDGVVGERTVGRLNRGIDAYTDQIRVNLERFRWLRYPAKGRYVVVNIPEYWLYAKDGDKVVTSMAVCVGGPRPAGYAAQYDLYVRTGQRRYEPKNHETPQLTGEFTHCILNPFWNVPWSIAAREIYYSAKKDSNYLRKGRYKVYYRDSLVDASKINWAEHNPYKMPFKFKQDPGEGNALGAIKFMFQNDFSIYLHDTPQQWAFKRAVRAVSHGCVRIQQPMDFARFLLEGTPDWDVPRLQKAIWSGARSKPVFLKKRAPLFIDYYTSWVDSAGVLQFRDDIYRKDARLVRVFKRLSQRSGA